ncbi:hypothetical protein DL93DRAFT_2127684 [Clavulina sp. PMI_390]|nr:hypothetical protein DL93DRAFT_2127684 [Clavulina sp. PMI_390]
MEAPTTASGNHQYPDPVKGASLLLSFKPTNRTVLVIGTNRLAAVRVLAALEADAEVVVASSQPLQSACDELKWRVDHAQARFIALSDDSLASIEQLLDSLPSTMLACVTDTLLLMNPATRRSASSAATIRDACTARRIPLNVTDMPALCDFTFPSTHRFSPTPNTAPTATPLPDAPTPSSLSSAAAPMQIAVTTNGQGCRLGGRIRREIAAKLHPQLGDAVANVARLRAIAKDEITSTPSVPNRSEKGGDREDDEGTSVPLNSPARYLGTGVVEEDPIERTARRMRWVNQISEYWPIERLAALREEEMQGMLDLKAEQTNVATESSRSEDCPERAPDSIHDSSRHGLVLDPSLAPTPPKGQIFLVGSGPGHPSMLTVAAHKALTKLATRVLSDKLVPPEVLALIPPHIPLYIAKKYPGNSEGAQNELMEMALEGAKKGETVVRLKQGDPMLYGRGGEEVLYFREHGFEPLVLPGVSSALAAPTFAGIPVTQRGAAETLLITTGVGRKGKSVTLPPYERSRTLVILMGVARLASLLEELRAHPSAAYPSYLPIAIVERASSPDQRLIAGTLETIEKVLMSPEVGEQRTPGMIVIGWVVLSLEGQGDLGVLDDASVPSRDNAELETVDRARVARWLGSRTGVVKDGLGREWAQFLDASS